MELELDIDGSGPLPPLLVVCGLDSQGRVMTSVRHDNEDKTKVDGFQTRGSFSQSIHYQVSEEAVRSLVAASSSCQQTISYECDQSALSDYAWWRSLSGETNTFCSGQPCSCDGRPGWSQDSLTVTDKSLLPVAAVFFGNIDPRSAKICFQELYFQGTPAPPSIRRREGSVLVSCGVSTRRLTESSPGEVSRSSS